MEAPAFERQARSLHCLMKRLFCLLLSFIAYLCIWASPASAQEISPEVADSLEAQILGLSFDDLPAFETDGFMLGYRDTIFQAEGQAGVDRYDQETEGYQPPYDPAREWLAGQFPSEVIKLGDLMYTGAGIEQLTMGDIGQLTGIDIENFQLADIPFLQDFTLSNLVGDVPFLGDYALVDLPKLAETIGGAGSEEMLSQYLTNNPEIGQMTIADSELGSLQVSDVPNLDSTHLGEMPEVGDDVIANVPGLSVMQFNQYPGLEMVGGLIPIAKQDISLGAKEYSGGKATPKPVSGGTNGKEVWEPIGCVGGCAHIELYDSDISPIKGAWAGSNWMTRAHRVRDGFGVLGAIFNEAGAYRLPFGHTFALQVRGTDEATGAATWGLAFRVCKRSPIDLGCTAYFMEVPLPITTHEGATILTGIKDGLGGSTQPIKAPDGWEDLRPDAPSKLQGIIGSNVSGGSLCGEGPGGINYGALGKAYGAIEGSYNSVGDWVDLGDRERGHGLGKYQYMSYREDVRAAISQQPGGAELLAIADTPGKPTAAQVARSFPSDVQDSLFMKDQKTLIERAMANGYEGERLLEILGQMHFYGPGLIEDGVIDSTTISDRHRRLTLKDYGEEFKNNYKRYLEGSESECKSTGNYINPIKGARYRPHSGFGTRFHPILGYHRLHGGVDLGGNPNELIVASDGGVVAYAGWDTSGFGNLIVITHDNGDETKYAHLNGFLVNKGERVKQGDSIGKLGTTGTSTAEHLHFELFKGGSRVDPEKYTDFSKGA